MNFYGPIVGKGYGVMPYFVLAKRHGKIVQQTKEIKPHFIHGCIFKLILVFKN